MSHFVRFLGAAALICALAPPATASAAHRRPAAKPLALAVSVASEYWGATPCAGRIKLRTRQALAPGLARDSDAWVTFGTAFGANNLAAPVSSFSDCTVSLAATRWPTRASMVQDWDMLCMTMTHEFGH
ncbi:MAG: hypothetical protein QOI80_933, partial [Solirubrobacteraceae bacterium]|nr:hypothetical protein [Solirubrobacteraceae bacterium]